MNSLRTLSSDTWHIASWKNSADTAASSLSRRLGYTEADVPRLIAESRRENRGHSS
jgi:hypothetical protein